MIETLGVCQVSGCQKAWVMLMRGHRLCTVHSDAVIDWARQASRRADTLTAEEVAAVMNGHPGPKGEQTPRRNS